MWRCLHPEKILVVIFLLLSRAAWACPSCYPGGPNNWKGYFAATLLMLILPFLGSGALAIYFFRQKRLKGNP